MLWARPFDKTAARVTDEFLVREGNDASANAFAVERFQTIKIVQNHSIDTR